MTNSSHCIVISQPMFFPWVGLFEQIRLADTFVHFDDVQLPQGRSFITRVQIKTSQGVQWLTVPIQRGTKLISDSQIDYSQNWTEKHLKTLHHAYGKAPHWKELETLIAPIYSSRISGLSDFNCLAIEKIAEFFDFRPTFRRSSDYGFQANSSHKLLDLIEALDGRVYVTGHGARNYLDHELFDARGIEVKYMTYLKLAYPQLHGGFTPYVSIIDLIANCGKSGAQHIRSGATFWKDFLAHG